jgi:Domain of Unknown Function (DUF928)
MAFYTMRRGNSRLNLRFFLSFTLMGLSLVPVGVISAIAKPLATKRVSSKVIFMPPPTDKKPPKTSGAGSRGGECMQGASASVNASVKPPLMALMPVVNTGLTVAKHPSFWVYIPETPAKQVVLSLRQNGSKPHSQTFFDSPKTPGVISLSLPQSAPALEIGKTYQWAVTLICGEKPSPNDPVIVSWVSRAASAPLNQLTALEQAAAYGRQGIWFDALTALAQARRSQPNQTELQTTWANFLTSAGLQIIVSEPLLPEVNP